MYLFDLFFALITERRVVISVNASINCLQVKYMSISTSYHLILLLFLLISLTNTENNTYPYGFMNCNTSIRAWLCSSKIKFAPRDTINVKTTTTSLTLLNVSHCQSIALSTKCCWLSMQTWGNPRLSTTLTQRVMSQLLGDQDSTQ